jgi:hypothetical protein
MSVKRDFGSNIAADRSYKLDEDMDAFSFVIGGSEVGSVSLPTAAAQVGGRGIIQHLGKQNRNGTIAFAGISRFRKSAAAINKDDPLTLAAAPRGSLRTAVPGESVYCVSMAGYTATEEHGYCTLIPGGGNLVIPRLTAKKSLGVTGDAELTDLAIPAGYQLLSLAARNKSANAVTVKFGKTSGTQTIVAPVAVGASAIKDFTLLINTFSFSQDQAIFVSSADWNSAEIDVYAVLVKLT